MAVATVPNVYVRWMTESLGCALGKPALQITFGIMS